MNPATQIYFEPFDVDERLSRLSLTRDPFDKAAKESFAAFASCTENHPPTFPGTLAWAEGNRSLRDSLRVVRWFRKNETNQPVVVNENGDTGVTVASGDKYTGIKDAFPSTASAKGRQTRDGIKANQYTLAFIEDTAAVVASARIPGRSTWIFLIYRDMERGQLRYELSLPRSMAEDGHIDDWSERIIFEPVPFEPNDIPRTGEDDGGQSPEITVEIRKLG
jgi:hypothetical protein